MRIESINCLVGTVETSAGTVVFTLRPDRLTAHVAERNAVGILTERELNRTERIALMDALASSLEQSCREARGG